MIRARARRREPLSLLEISVVDQYWFESIEVNRPAFVGARRDGHRYLRPRELLATLAANLKPFLAIDPVGPLRVPDQALRSQHVVQRRIAVARVALSELLLAGAKLAVIGEC